MFFSKSKSKQNVITKYSIRASLATALLCSLVGATIYLNQTNKTVAESANYYGEVVQFDLDTPKTEPLVDSRKNCRIAQWGVAPVLTMEESKDFTWEVAMRKAMLKSSLPIPVIDKTITRLREDSFNQFVSFNNDYGVSSDKNNRYMYYPEFSTTFRHNGRYGVCLTAQTAFKEPTKREFAKLYLVEHEGVVWHLGEFLACYNLSIFKVAPPGWIPYVDPSIPSSIAINKVPEPHILWLMIPLLLILARLKRK